MIYEIGVLHLVEGVTFHLSLLVQIEFCDVSYEAPVEPLD